MNVLTKVRLLYWMDLLFIWIVWIYKSHFLLCEIDNFCHNLVRIVQSKNSRLFEQISKLEYCKSERIASSCSKNV